MVGETYSQYLNRCSTSVSYHEKLQKHFHDYEREHGSKPTQLTDVAHWIIAKGLWDMPRSDIVQRCAEELADALREEYRTDPKGRRYRANHAVREKTGTLWADLDTAPHKHMEVAFSQRRRLIVGNCVQLRTDVDVYNDKASPKEPVPNS